MLHVHVTPVEDKKEIPFGMRKIFFLHQIQFVEFAKHNSGLNRSYYCEYGVSLWHGESGVWQKLGVV